MRFLKTAGIIHYFAFECEGCGERCELGVDSEFTGRRVECPAGRGASYVMWDDPPAQSPDLFCVVKPGFVEADELPEFDEDDFVEDDFDDGPDDYDELEEALGECGRGADYEGCMNAGSEYCEFECPFRN